MSESLRRAIAAIGVDAAADDDDQEDYDTLEDRLEALLSAADAGRHISPPSQRLEAMTTESDAAELDDLFAMDGAEFFDEGTSDPPPKQAENQSAAGALASQRLGDGPTVYFDIETIPDEGRAHLFGLEPIAELGPEVPLDKCPDLEATLAGTVEEVKRRLRAARYATGWFGFLQAAETAGKARKGVIDAIRASGDIEGDYAAEVAARRKLLSTTPEFCRIAAMAWAIDGAGIDVLMLDQPSASKPGTFVTEHEILEQFWLLASAAGRLVGFNCLAFDLPVILVRSALLGVLPSRKLNTSLYGGDVVDLYLARFGGRGNTSKDRPGKLKDLARIYGIPVLAGDLDGSQVEAMFASNPEQLAWYVKSDVLVTRDLHRFYQGFFCL